MKININNPFAAKAMIAFAALMAFFYLAGGLYFLIAGIHKAHWQWVLMGGVFLLYGSVRSLRMYQKDKNENT